jgi:hypothetical protein
MGFYGSAASLPGFYIPLADILDSLGLNWYWDFKDSMFTVIYDGELQNLLSFKQEYLPMFLKLKCNLEQLVLTVKSSKTVSHIILIRLEQCVPFYIMA